MPVEPVGLGVFVDVGEGVDGLVHESKLPRSSVAAHPEIASGVGALVKVLGINEEKHQISLRLIERAESDELQAQASDPEEQEQAVAGLPMHAQEPPH
jgi:ribosomal protein S1